jgi:hypothetical protein
MITPYNCKCNVKTGLEFILELLSVTIFTNVCSQAKNQQKQAVKVKLSLSLNN